MTYLLEHKDYSCPAIMLTEEVTCVSPVVEEACGDASDEGRIHFAVSALLLVSHLSMGAAFTVFFAVAANHFDNTISKTSSPVCYGEGCGSCIMQ